MNEEWYLNIGSERVGPITYDELRSRLLAMGNIPDNALVWSVSTVEWVHPRDVPGLLTPPAEQSSQSAYPAPVVQSTSSAASSASSSASSSSSDTFNPYAAPSAPIGTTSGVPAPQEAGFYKLDVGTCITAAWNMLISRPLMPIVLALIFIAITLALQIPMRQLMLIVGPAPGSTQATPGEVAAILGVNAIYQIIMTFFGLGAILFMLNFVQQKSLNLANLFSGGPYLLTAVIGGFLMLVMIFCLIMVVGIPLSILGFLIGGEGNMAAMLIPIIIAYVVAIVFVLVRFGQFQYLIVAEKAGPVECLKLSYSLTRDNFLAIVLLVIISIGIVLLGILALLVGLLFALPLVWVIWASAFQLMRYGPNSLPS